MNKLSYGDNIDVLRKFIRDERFDLFAVIAESDLSDRAGCKPDVRLNKLPSLKETNWKQNYLSLSGTVRDFVHNVGFAPPDRRQCFDRRTGQNR
jgi:hypothetical protein